MSFPEDGWASPSARGFSKKKKKKGNIWLNTDDKVDETTDHSLPVSTGVSRPLQAPVPFEWYCSSEPFRFIVGSDKKEYILHSDLVAFQSPKLEALVHGDMKEAQERCVHWEEEEVDTFIRFGQFLYTGQYKAAEPEPRQVYASAPPFVKPENVDWDELITDETKSQKKLEPSQSSHLWPRFKNLHPSTAEADESDFNEAQASYDHTEVFLSHAKIYVFADYHGIEKLQLLALKNLRKVLSQFRLTEEGLHDITQLAKYCFENTTDRNGVGDRLSDLVGLYAACHLSHLWKSEDFRKLVDMPNFSHGLITLALAPGSLN